MTSLTLKRAKFSRPDGQWSDEDYDVIADGKVVGRILQENTSGPPELRWMWSLMATPATPGLTNGTAATREERRWRSFGRRGRKQTPTRRGKDAGRSRFRLRNRVQGHHHWWRPSLP
jgi:hypothetical protein